MSDTQKQYDSLTQALLAHRIPLENHRTIERLTRDIGISAHFGTSSYIRAVRDGDGRDLHIHSGWTNGFTSEAEASSAAAHENLAYWRSSRNELWGITHPKNGIGGGGGGDQGRTSRDYGTCPGCSLMFSAAGTCRCD